MVTNAPAETDILCENCGYILNGLPESGNCPECGTPIDVSIAERFRSPPVWERRSPRVGVIKRFMVTSAQLIFQPRKFFRTTTSRGDVGAAKQFANIHYLLAGILLGAAMWMHWNMIFDRMLSYYPRPPAWESPVLAVLLPAATYAAIVLTVRLATRLTVWEAAYRGFRLPHQVVIRALYYHAAHCLPVALLVLGTVVGYDLLLSLGVFARESVTIYLYVLCGEVLVLAGYLFNTYWIAMRNLMYANR
jgi:hypothetical protein